MYCRRFDYSLKLHYQYFLTKLKIKNMKKISIAFLLGILLCSFSNTLFAQQDQRIHAAYMITFGRDASQGEVNYWLTRGNLSISQLIDFHRQYLNQDANTHRTTIDRAYQDAMGRHATEGEIQYWLRGNDTYTTLMQNHVNYLAQHPFEYGYAISRSYKYVFNRPATQAEINYWINQGGFSYVMLVGMHQDFQRRNVAKESSSNRTNFNNSPALVTVSLSQAIAKEALKASGIVATGGGNIVAAGGGNIVAAGGGNIVAAGGGNIVAAGGGNFRN